MAISTQETRFLLTAKDKTKVALKSAKMGFKDVGKAVTGVHTKLLGLAGIGGMGALTMGIIDTNREMQTLQSSLKTVTGSTEAAADAFAKIEKFAVTTPFDLNQWTEAFIKMKALGLDPSEAALNSYGNTAAAMGKDLNQMIEAVADAATGEFERLKEFGIKASKQGDEVSFVFQGVTTTIGNNAAEIEKYLQGIGNNQFGSAMADQMDNLGPAFSNLNQAFATLAVKIGEAGLNDMVLNLARSTTEFVNSFDDAKMLTITNFFNGLATTLSTIIELGSKLNIAGWLAEDITKRLGMPGPGQIRPGNIPGYQLGDFNASGGSLETLKRQQALAGANPEEAKKTRQAMEKNNEFQAQILEAIRNQQNVAVAG